MDKIDLAAKPIFFANENLTSINSKLKLSQANVAKTVDTMNDDRYSMDNIAKTMGFKQSYEEVQKNAEKYYQENYGMTILEFLKLSRQEQVRYTGENSILPLTGYTSYVPDIHTKAKPMDLKISIFGKLLGYDPNFSEEQIQDLKDFINESKGLAVEQIKSLYHDQKLYKGGMIRDNPFLFDEFVDYFYKSPVRAQIYFRFVTHGEGTISLLDSDLNVEDFKTKWAKQVINIRFGLKISDEDAKNALEIFRELNTQNQQNQTKQVIDEINSEDKTKNDEKFTPIQGFSADNTTYKDDSVSRLKKIYEIIKREFDNGKTELELLKLIYKTDVNLKV